MNDPALIDLSKHIEEKRRGLYENDEEKDDDGVSMDCFLCLYKRKWSRMVRLCSKGHYVC